MKAPVRLHMNEMPYAAPEGVISAAREGLAHLHRYADGEEMQVLKDLVAEASETDARRVVLSPGSDILLRELVYLFSRGRNVMVPSPSFFSTIQAAKHTASRITSLRLFPPRFDLDPDMILELVREPSLVIIDNPNNPTGQPLLDRPMVESLLGNPDVLLVIDEAYYGFFPETFAGMVQQHRNLAVTRTLDKIYSLAGARIGYMVAGDAFLEPFSLIPVLLPQASLYAAVEAMRNPEYVSVNVARIIQERDRMTDALRRLNAVVYPSSANFLLVETGQDDIAPRLRERGVLITDLSSQMAPGYVRVSIGSREENDIFLDAYEKINA